MELKFGHWTIAMSLGDAFFILLIPALWYVIFLHPIVRIIRRVGYNGWNVLWFFVPGANLIALWSLAYRPWPAFKNAEISN